MLVILRLLNLPGSSGYGGKHHIGRTKAWKWLPDQKVVELATKIVEQSWTLEKKSKRKLTK